VENKTTVSFPILGILGLIFVTLKLGGWGVVATWSWIWVLSPFWIPFAFVLGLLGVFGILFVIGKMLK
tara:strand:+ start:28855 stop:29058 length:204 start_codon:yes stop_codon:yes gene_type:complete